MRTVSQGILYGAIEAYPFQGELRSAKAYGSGHINDTFLLEYTRPQQRIILQRVNREVFLNPVELMENIDRVTRFLREKILAEGGDPSRETLRLLPDRKGKNYYIDREGNYWRAYPFIEGAASYDAARSVRDFYACARAFGHFQKMLADFPATSLHETIPGFHDTARRLARLKEVVQSDPCGRVNEVRKEIAFVLERESITHYFATLVSEEEIPIRVTHNDTKLNNIMIDHETGKGICVIDLDTVMPGLSVNDFGDAIRFGASIADEDEPDLSKVLCSLDYFEAFTRGFLEECKAQLTSREIDLLPMGARVMTFECGIRFLTDYLEGDHYFKIHRSGQNLDRARTQFKLVADMESKWEQMKEIVDCCRK